MASAPRISEHLLAWYRRHGRSTLPWRTDPTPYRVTVSEFMLQQTQVERVIPLFLRFVERFPSIDALAAGPRAEVIRLWQGLGYNTRAVRLHRLAEHVVAEYGGIIPEEGDRLAALPGIGPYTRAAIRAFAFNKPAVAIDTNLRRVIHRLFWGIEHPPQADAAAIEAIAWEMLHDHASREWNAAMMDLGASICTSRAPRCMLCPLQTMCVAAPIERHDLIARARAHAPSRGPQSRMPFEQTQRFLRGRIVDHLRSLPITERISRERLGTELAPFLQGRTNDALATALADLLRDGLVSEATEGVALRE